MKKAVRWKSKAYGIFYWHDSAVRWKPEPSWIEDRNLLLHRLYEARFYYPESKDDIKIVLPSKNAQKLDELKKELVAWMGKCSYLDAQVAELLDRELFLENENKRLQEKFDCKCADKDNNKPQRYHVLTCPMSGYVKDDSGMYNKP